MKVNLIILLNGFQKKSQKTPSREIKKAEKLKDEYYENK
jgi:phage-related protein